jgi:cytochrome c peroxidase
MSTRRKDMLAFAILALGILTSCNADKDKKQVSQVPTDQSQEFALTDTERTRVKSSFSPLPSVANSENNPVTDAKVSLGKRLFLDEALSNPDANSGRRISCNTCHLLDNFGVDGLDRSIGILDEKVPVNAPTVFNAALHKRQFWDGRAADVEEQALGPITALKEMGFTSSVADQQKVLAQLTEADATYPSQFVEAFGGDVANAFTFVNVGKAIGAFERTLLTPSRFDAFLQGDEDALVDAEKQGLRVFLNAGGVGCVSCHSGVAIGGERLVSPPTNLATGDTVAIAAYLNAPSAVKIPSLRNIEKTGPYFHAGAVDSLDDAIRIMGTYTLGVEFNATDIASLKAFLLALTGEVPASAQ